MTPDVELVWDGRDALGENPVWDDRRHALWWLDILGGEIHLLDVETRRDHVWMSVEGEVGMLALDAGGDLVVGVENRLLHVSGRGVRSVPHARPRGDRFNDGKADPSGRLVVGTMTRDQRLAASGLYRLDESGLTCLLPDVTLSNGLAWSTDGGTLFHADTVLERIDAFVVDPQHGSLSGRRTLVDLANHPGRPDGLTIDSEGRLWVAMARGGTVRCFGTDGREQLSIPLPVTSVTSCVFGGGDLTDLWVTTASMGEPTGPGDVSGGVFRLRGLDAQGLPAARVQVLPAQ